MRIFEIYKAVNPRQPLNENLSLSQLRKKIEEEIENRKAGKTNKALRIDMDEEVWFEDEKNQAELLSLVKKVVGKDKLQNLKSLSNYDVSRVFKNKTLKPLSLKKDLTQKIASVEGRNRWSSQKENLDSEYEMMISDNGTEVYSVFTPRANIYLSHKLLKSSIQPVWCTASPGDAYSRWVSYGFHTAKYPAVFIIAKKNGNMHDKMKYQIVFYPDKVEAYVDGEIGLADAIMEWRDAGQTEKTYGDTSLFRYMGISVQDLSAIIHSLMISNKGSQYSKKFGYDYFKNEEKNIKKAAASGDDYKRIKLLVQSCQNGTFEQYAHMVKDDEKLYFIDKAIEYNTINDAIVDELGTSWMTQETLLKIIKYFIKGRKCNSSIIRYYFESKINNTKLLDEIINRLDIASFDLEEIELLWDNNVEKYDKKLVDIYIQEYGLDKELLQLIINYGKFKLFEKILSNINNPQELLDFAFVILQPKNCKNYFNLVFDKIIKKNLHVNLLNFISDKDFNPAAKVNVLNYIFNILVKYNKCDEDVLMCAIENDVHKKILSSIIVSMIDNGKKRDVAKIVDILPIEYRKQIEPLLKK